MAGKAQATRTPTIEADPCSVCLNSPMLKPIYQCKNGHILCVTCEHKVLTCPSCRVALPKVDKIRNTVLERIQPELIKCQHKACGSEHLTDEDLAIHLEKSCEHVKRKFCRISGVDKKCKTLFKATEKDAIIAHLSKNHAISTTVLTPYQSLKLPQDNGYVGVVFQSTLWLLKKKIIGNAGHRIVPIVFAGAAVASKHCINTEVVIHKKTYEGNEQIGRTEHAIKSVGPGVSILKYTPGEAHLGIVEIGSQGLPVSVSCYLTVK